MKININEPTFNIRPLLNGHTASGNEHGEDYTEKWHIV
jgi:hypothetical protein